MEKTHAVNISLIMKIEKIQNINSRCWPREIFFALRSVWIRVVTTDRGRKTNREKKFWPDFATTRHIFFGIAAPLASSRGAIVGNVNHISRWVLGRGGNGGDSFSTRRVRSDLKIKRNRERDTTVTARKPQRIPHYVRR